MAKRPKLNRPDLEDLDPPKPANESEQTHIETFPKGMGETRAFEGEQYAALRNMVRCPDGCPESEILQAVINGKWRRDVVMLTPFNRPINPHAHYAMMAHIRKNPWLGYEYECNTVIQRARNFLADRFLKTEAEWSWWVDQDTVAPFGSAGFFYHTLGADLNKLPPQYLEGAHSLQRLLARGKKLVGAVYAQRKPNGKLVIQPDLHPRHEADEKLAAGLRQTGPRNDLIPVRYIATGCALVHRSVYEDIKTAHPELAPQREGDAWDFFGHDTNTSGEDIHFCKLAQDAGHQSYLDCSVFCAHLGEWAYLP